MLKSVYTLYLSNHEITPYCLDHCRESTGGGSINSVI